MNWSILSTNGNPGCSWHEQREKQRTKTKKVNRSHMGHLERGNLTREKKNFADKCHKTRGHGHARLRLSFARSRIKTKRTAEAAVTT